MNQLKTNMNIVYIIAIALTITYVGILGAYNYMPVEPINLLDERLGATVTTIAASDTLKNSRTVINTNFGNLNTDKLEISTWIATTSAPQLTTLANLITVNTITTGTWNADTLTVAYGGTGSTSLSGYHILLGSSTNALDAVLGLGTSGQFLTSGGANTAPTWTTSAVSTTIDYNWTGIHTFATTTVATTTIQALTSASTTFLTVMPFLPSADPTSDDHATRKSYVDDGNFEIFVDVANGSSTAGVGLDNDTNFATRIFHDGNNTWWYFNVRVPNGAASTTSIQVAYSRDANADLYLEFDTSHYDWTSGDTQTDDTTDNDTAYTCAAADGTLGFITVPARAYDGFTISSGDIIGLMIQRDASAGADTYNTTWVVYGVLFTFN